MNTFSIKELINATNSIFNSKNTKQKKIISKKKVNPKIIKIDQPLRLVTETISENKIQLNPINNQIIIETKVKDHIINELYLFAKKKIKKNTLKLIFEQQIEIKSLKNNIAVLEKKRNTLIENYNILKKDYEILLKNYNQLKINKEELTLQNNELKINNITIKHKLIDIDKRYEELLIEKEKLLINNSQLQNNLNLATREKENLVEENIKLKDNLKIKDKNFESTNQKNRSFEINNAELKNTISRYVVNSKKLHEQLNLAEKLKNQELNEINQKVKFYQDENVRLSGDLLLFQRKNENIKINLTDIEKEKEKISNKIKELSKSIEEKTNVVETTFSNKEYSAQIKDVEKINDKEQKVLDEVIGRIFQKI